MQLSSRLLCIADYINQEDRVADIGTDHAYLPVYLAKNNAADFLVAGELNRDPYLRAVNTVNCHGCSEAVQVRMGNGLEIIQNRDQIDTIVIAGMGGNTIIGILENGKEKLEKIKKMLLQPMNDSDFLRIWLSHNRWQITDEKLVEEDKKIYEIIIVQRGQERAEGLALRLGPRLIDKRDALLSVYLGNILLHKINILKQLNNSSSPESQIKAECLRAETEQLALLLEKVEAKNG